MSECECYEPYYECPTCERRRIERARAKLTQAQRAYDQAALSGSLFSGGDWDECDEEVEHG